MERLSYITTIFTLFHEKSFSNGRCIWEGITILFPILKRYIYLFINGEVKFYNYHICLLFMKNHSPRKKVFEKTLHFIFFNAFCTTLRPTKDVTFPFLEKVISHININISIFSFHIIYKTKPPKISCCPTFIYIFFIWSIFLFGRVYFTFWGDI